MPGQHLLRGGVDARGIGRVDLHRVEAGMLGAIRSSSPVRRPPVMTVFPRACSSRARARPIPLVEPGMKTVFPRCSCPESRRAAAAGAESGYRGIGGPWLTEASGREWGHGPGSSGRLPAPAPRGAGARDSGPRARRRRTRGLRREEVASLAVMSVDYYTRLEQQRGPQPSEQMLGSLARALRLTSGERDYLFQVAGHMHGCRPRRTSPPHCCGCWTGWRTPRRSSCPSRRDARGEPDAAALFGDESAYTGLARSGIYRWFTDPAERLRYPQDDRDRQSRAQVANLRRVRVDGPAVAGRGTRARAADVERGVRRAVGAARGGQALRGPQDAHPSRARPGRAGLPGAVHRGPVPGAARADRSPPPRGTRSCNCSPCWARSGSPARGPAACGARSPRAQLACEAQRASGARPPEGAPCPSHACGTSPGSVSTRSATPPTRPGTPASCGWRTSTPMCRRPRSPVRSPTPRSRRTRPTATCRSRGTAPSGRPRPGTSRR